MTETVIKIQNLAKTFRLVELERLLQLKPGMVFRRVDAVKSVSIEVGARQVYGFLGPNGAGKTTTIKMCMDLITPSSGSITLWGKPPRDHEVKMRIGYVPEHPYFYDYLKPQEILDYFGRLFGLDRVERKKRIDKLLDRVGLDHARNRALRRFSKGMLQRLGVAQSLINNPDLLVYDEPLSGLDPQGRKDIRDIIIEERDKGKTIFFSSHILSDIEHLCDRVAIMSQGELRKEGELKSLLISGARESEVVLRNTSPELRDALTARDYSFVDLGAGTQKVVVESQTLDAFLAEVLAGGALIDQVHPHRDSLEDLFLRESA